MADPYKSVVATLGLSIPGLDLKKSGLDKTIKKAVQQNWSMNQLLLALYASPAFKQRFPGIRNQDGTLRMSPSAYLQQETALRTTMKSYGLGHWWYGKPSDLGKYIAAGITPEKLEQRLQVSQTLLRSNPERVERLQGMYAMSAKDAQFGALGWLLNPGKGNEWFEQRVSAAQIANSAQQAGFNAHSIGRGTFEGLAGEGVTGSQANQVFAQAAIERGQLQTLARRFDAGELTDKQIALSLFHPDPQIAGLRQSLFAQEKAMFTTGPGFETGQGGGVAGLRTTEARDR